MSCFSVLGVKMLLELKTINLLNSMHYISYGDFQRAINTLVFFGISATRQKGDMNSIVRYLIKLFGRQAGSSVPPPPPPPPPPQKIFVTSML